MLCFILQLSLPTHNPINPSLIPIIFIIVITISIIICPIYWSTLWHVSSLLGISSIAKLCSFISLTWSSTCLDAITGFQLNFIILRSNDLTHINSSGLSSWKALIQLVNCVLICLKLIKSFNAYLFIIFGIESQTGFQRSPSLSKKKLNFSENK